MKQQLRELYVDVLQRIDTRRAMHTWRDVLDAEPDRALLLIAFGKAARPMAEAMLELSPGRRRRQVAAHAGHF